VGGGKSHRRIGSCPRKWNWERKSKRRHRIKNKDLAMGKLVRESESPSGARGKNGLKERGSLVCGGLASLHSI